MPGDPALSTELFYTRNNLF